MFRLYLVVVMFCREVLSLVEELLRLDSQFVHSHANTSVQWYMAAYTLYTQKRRFQAPSLKTYNGFFRSSSG